MDTAFVKASIVIASPGDVLYSRLGHAFFRMECPAYDLDYCFSYESESIKNKVLRFIIGDLKMGMTAVPTADLFQMYQKSGRTLSLYNLNLADSQKRRLWKLLDDKVGRGMNLPYDYVARGCAYSCLTILEEALYPASITYTDWPGYFLMTRRELVKRQLMDYPCTRFLLDFLAGSEGDRNVSCKEKVVTPTDLLYVFQHSMVDGHYLCDTDASLLLDETVILPKRQFNLPLLCSILLLALTLWCVCFKKHFHEYILLTLQFSVGVFLTYMIVFSSLPCTEWNWLYIAFNPLPLLMWKWRRYWIIPYVVTLAAFVLIQMFYPHKIMESADSILIVCFIVMLLFNFINIKKV